MGTKIQLLHTRKKYVCSGDSFLFFKRRNNCPSGSALGLLHHLVNGFCGQRKNLSMDTEKIYFTRPFPTPSVEPSGAPMNEKSLRKEGPTLHTFSRLHYYYSPRLLCTELLKAGSNPAPVGLRLNQARAVSSGP